MKNRVVKIILSSVLICSFICGCSGAAPEPEEIVVTDDIARETEADEQDEIRQETKEDEDNEDNDAYTNEAFWFCDDDAIVNQKAQKVFEDISRINGGKEIIVTDDKGYITFLIGSVIEKQCITEQDFNEALEAVLPALSPRSDLQFKLVEWLIDDKGNRFVNFKEVFGEDINDINTVKLFFDPEGKMYGLSSTILPFSNTSGEEIDDKKAVDIVIDHMSKDDPGVTYTVVPDGVKRKFTHQTNPYSGVEYLKEVYVVTTNNPHQGEKTSEAPYLDHRVGLQGAYMDSTPAYVNSEVDNNRDYGILDKWFSRASITSYKTSVILGDGIQRDIEVPVVYDDGMYYLEDPKRKMLCAEYYDFKYKDTIRVISSKTNDDWEIDDVVAYYNYIKCYDFYDDDGWTGPDGVGGQTVLLMDYVDENKQPIDNLCYLGRLENAHLFVATSEGDGYSMSMDVAGHEYSHAVTSYAVSGIMYKNETGVINEGICDIMGELVELKDCEEKGIELQLGDIFAMGQSTGVAIRDLYMPTLREQASEVGGLYFVPSVSIPDDINDHGGVHINSGIVSSICGEMYFDKQIPIAVLQDIWEVAFSLMTPASGYEELAKILPLACEMSGYPELIDDVNDMVLTKRLGSQDPFEAFPAGFVQVKFTLPPWIDWTRTRMVMRDLYNYTFVGWPQKGSNTIYMVVDEGSYQIQLTEFDIHENAIGSWIYTLDGWSSNKDAKASYVIVSADNQGVILEPMKLN